MKTNGHNANYYFELLKKVHYNLHDGYFQTDDHHWRGDCANRYITIHHSEKVVGKPEGTYYHINMDGSVTQKNVYDYHDVTMTLDDLTGDDFELFSTIQIYKSGYVVLEAPENESDVKGYAKKVLSNLAYHIESLAPDWWQRHSENQVRDYPLMVGGSYWDNGLTEEFQYCSLNGMEIHIQTIHEFCKENENRKYFGCLPIPFRKDMDSNLAFHVTLVDFMRKDVSEEQRMKQCNDAVREMMGYITNTTIPTREYDFEIGDYKKISVRGAKWINVSPKVPLYDN